MQINSTDASALLQALSIPLSVSTIPDEIYPIFCDTMREDMDKLDEALNKSDIAATKALAHRMKGAFEVLSIPTGAAACRELEQISVATEHTQIQLISAALRTYLREFIPS